MCLRDSIGDLPHLRTLAALIGSRIIVAGAAYLWRVIAPLLCLLALPLWPAQNFAAETGSARVYRVAIDREYEPYEFIDKEGAARGFTPALLQTIGSGAGLRFEFLPLAWPDALRALDSGSVDIVSMIRTPERAARYAFSAPHSRITQAIFRNREKRDIVDLASLAGHSVGLQKDDIAVAHLGDRIDITPRLVTSKLEGLLLLNQGSLDAFMCAQQAGVRLVSEYHLQYVELAAGDLFAQDYAFALRKERREVVELLNRELARLDTSGELQRLRTQWLQSNLAAPGWLERNWELVLVLVGLLSAAVILVLMWNRSLRRMVLLRVRDLRASEQRLHFALSAARMVAWRWNISGDTLNWAEPPASLIGPEHAGGYPDFRELVHPGDRAAFLLAGRQAIAQGTHYRVEFRITRTDGVVRWIEARGMPSANDAAGQIDHMDGVSQDITERKETEAKIDRISKLYAALNQCNQAIVHSSNEEELFPQICRAAVDFGDLKMAWVGVLDEAGTVLKPVAAYGGHTEYLQDLRITTTADDPSGRGPTGVAVRENRPVWCQDFQNDPMTAPWHERGARFGWHASASLPLRRDDAVIGAFSVYAGEVYAFDETVRESLIEMAADISFVLGNFERERRRKRAEAALMENQLKLQIILDTALDAVIRMDAQGIIIGWNARAEKIFGWTRSEALGRALHETIIPPELHEAHLCGLQHFLETDKGPILNRRMEARALHRDGHEFPVELAVAPVKTEGRYEFNAFVSDITERKQAQVALAEAKQRLEIALEGSQISVWEIDLRTNQIWLDADWAVLLGLPRAETRTAVTALHALVHPDDRRKTAAAAVDTMKGKFASYAVEHRVKCASGEWKWILSRGRVIERDAGGQALRMSGTNTDITESKRDELLLALEHAVVRCLALEKDASSALQAVMRAICESMNWERSTYWRADEAAGLMRFGRSWEVSGLGLERYAERSRSMVFAPGTGLVGRVWQTGEPLWVPDFGNDPRAVQQALARETGIHCVFVFPVTSEGRTIGALAFFSREVREPDERLLALTRVIGGELGQFLQRKQAEDQVRKLNSELEARVTQRTQQLQAANNELEAFSYSVSHDLRAPLRAIQGFSLLVEQQYAGQLDSTGRDMLLRVGAGAQKMGLLIDDLLRLARISRQEMRVGRVDLSALAQEAADDLQGAEPERRVEWSIAPQVSVEGDPGLLRVMLQNLIGNAWKYSSRRELARIEFGVGEKDGRPAYFVRDNGAGFDMAYAGKLFGAFQRLHSATEFPGTGIGLATVARIIHRHGGTVSAEGREGEGATFYFSLAPAQAPADGQRAT